MLWHVLYPSSCFIMCGIAHEVQMAFDAHTCGVLHVRWHPCASGRVLVHA